MATGKPAIFVDIDGCLLPPRGEVSPQHQFALILISRLVREANIGAFPPIKLCTGRDRCYVDAVVKSIGLLDSACIIENGAVIFNPCTKETEVSPEIDDESKRIFALARYKVVPKILREFPYLFLYPGNIFNISFERNRNATIISAEAIFKSVRKRIRELVGEKHFLQKKVRTIRQKSATTITHPAATKKMGLSIVAKREGIQLSNSIGIGDEAEDIHFMELLGCVGCPSNADEVCKKYVQSRRGHVSMRPFAEGVFDVIDHYLEIKC